MRLLIVSLLLFCYNSSSLYAKKTDTRVALQKLDTKLTHFNKKHKNSLKTEFFSHQLDFLNLSNQNHSLFNDCLGVLVQGPLIYSTGIDFNYSLRKEFSCAFSFQDLYPKHSFW